MSFEKRRFFLIICGIVATGSVYAVERQVVEGMSVQGSREQPKVLYIVPWQPPESPELTAPEPDHQLDVLKPIERDFYRQSLFYRRHLKLGHLPDAP